MGKRIRDERGFTLIAALLLTLLLSGLAVGLFFLVNEEQYMGTNDLQSNVAFYGAESGMENLTAQLSQLYQTSQTPSAAALCALTSASNFPTAISGSNISNMNYVENIYWPPATSPPCPATNPTSTWDIVGAGPDQGMVASMIPFTLAVTATIATGSSASPSGAVTPGASVNLTRTLEEALLPAFEFGIFCAYDCDYFAGPNYNFGGRVHANGNLFLASGSTLTFTGKVAAVNQIVMDQLENGWPTNNGYQGQVYIPTAAGGCPPAPGAGPAANCVALPAGSWSGGFPPPPAPATCTADCGGTTNAGWKGISTGTFNNFVINGLTGATKLQLPFAQADAVGPIEIIRRPQATDTPLLSSSRLYNEATIRILIADTLGDLHPERGGAALDADDVQIGVSPTASGTTTSAELNYNGSPVDYMYFGVATAGPNGWVAPTNPATGTAYGWNSWPLASEITASPVNVAAGAAPAAASVWLRVEYLSTATGNWTGVTRQWLGYGFGRGYDMPPTAPWGAAACTLYPTFPAGQCANPISPAILILQQLQQGDTAASAYENDTTDTNGTANNWIPINFYDSREGEPRDNAARTSNTTATNNTTVYTPCSPIGVMNAVELDVGNLWLWLQKTGPYTGGSGSLVNNTNENGYILYFSDRRGMMPDLNPPAASLYNKIPGTSGLEDTVNSASNTGVPDNALEPATYYSYSPEDVDLDGYFDVQGEKNLAAGFGLTGALTSQPYFPIPANAPNSPLNQVNCSSDTENAAGTSNYTYPPGTGTVVAAAVFSGNPQNNVVYGPRHALRLVDGGMSAAAVSYLPHPIPPLVAPTCAPNCNGFTVASEEPVYVLGDYNTGVADPFWPSENTPTAVHSAAAIIADTVTLLSNPPTTASIPPAVAALSGWTDAQSFLQPGNVGNRNGNATSDYYRMAIAAGKSIPFPQPGWATAIPVKDFGTDGGMHNFLRYLENMGYNGATVNYAGSMISMYYSQYATGTFKCCNVVYSPPNRNYFFDTQFLNPNNLPPGTPMFQDTISLSSHQNFTPQ
jgi:hypothetical protein